jgi:membrane AbrB-like protein
LQKLIKVSQSWVEAFSPASFPYARFLAALLIGTLGGWAFVQARLPLPWMLGSMTACTLAALVRAPIAAPSAVRPPMTMIIGVMLGVGFTPQILESVANWLPTVLGLTGFILISGVACVAYFRRVAGSTFNGLFRWHAGGLVEMVIVGEDKGGDARTIALVHSARVLLVVLTLPFLVQIIGGTALGARPQLGVSILDTPWRDELWLISTALAGALLGHVLRLPARLLLGPMLLAPQCTSSAGPALRQPLRSSTSHSSCWGPHRLPLCGNGSTGDPPGPCAVPWIDGDPTHGHYRIRRWHEPRFILWPSTVASGLLARRSCGDEPGRALPWY